MENRSIFIEPLLERVEEYGKTSFELYKLKAISQTAKLVSTLVSRGVVVLMLLMFISILTIGVSLWLGDLLGKSYYGFFCVAGFYAFIGIVLYFFLNNKIKKNVSNSIISILLN